MNVEFHHSTKKLSSSDNKESDRITEAIHVIRVSSLANARLDMYMNACIQAGMHAGMHIYIRNYTRHFVHLYAHIYVSDSPTRIWQWTIHIINKTARCIPKVSLNEYGQKIRYTCKVIDILQCTCWFTIQRLLR